jgi:hypothetical protein
MRATEYSSILEAVVRHWSANEYSSAIAYIDGLEYHDLDQTTRSRALVLKCYSLFYTEDTSAARRMLAEAQLLAQHSFWATQDVVTAYWKLFNDTKSAIVTLNEYLSGPSEVRSDAEFLLALSMLIRLKLAEGELVDARRLLKTIAENLPHNATARKSFFDLDMVIDCLRHRLVSKDLLTYVICIDNPLFLTRRISERRFAHLRDGIIKLCGYDRES